MSPNDENFELVVSDNMDIEGVDSLSEWTTEDIAELMACLQHELDQRVVNLNAAEEYYGQH